MAIPHIPAGEFKAQCLQLMNDVNQKQISIIITKRGEPVAKMVPINNNDKTFFGCLANSVTINDDIVAPIDEDWEADA
ncbi:MAG: antitoxin [marine bacterium B5-7]|nr:MAG: antitoxin [marine bacterium B5-7]